MPKQRGDKPIIDPILSLTSKPRKESIIGGGKNQDSIKKTRLKAQRKALSESLESISSMAQKNSVLGHVAVVIKMFSDSLAPSYAPTDLFWSGHGANLIAPYKGGYLAEVKIAEIPKIIALIKETDKVKHLVDISRISSVEILSGDHVLSDRNADTLIDQAIKITQEDKEYSEFMVWFVPFSTQNLRAEAVKSAAKSLDVKGLEPKEIESAKGRGAEVIDLPDERSLIELFNTSRRKVACHCCG